MLSIVVALALALALALAAVWYFIAVWTISTQKSHP